MGPRATWAQGHLILFERLRVVARRGRPSMPDGLRVHATFTEANGETAFGELKLRRAKTTLRLRSERHIAPIVDGSDLHGITPDREYVSCIRCVKLKWGSICTPGPREDFYGAVFPHFVTVGNRHFDSSADLIEKIHFRTEDLPALFDDFDAFGQVVDAKDVARSVLKIGKQRRSIEAGEHPIVQYFTGRCNVTDVKTEIGRLSVNHRPRFGVDGTSGAYIKSNMCITVEPYAPVTLDEALDRLMTIVNFLSVAAGRGQEVKGIEVSTVSSGDSSGLPLSVYWSHAWKSDKSLTHREPHPSDVPFHPVRRPEEFKAALKDWVQRDAGWRLARTRYMQCLQMGNRYSPERLVAAANLFDILPPEAVPSSRRLSAELSITRDRCIAMLKQHSPDIDRNSVLDALARMGEPSLPKKVQHRVAMVAKAMGPCFPELEYVAGMATRVRNLFVHGNKSNLDYTKVERMTPFLTDALEFAFSASDLIEAGWNAGRWCRDSHGWGHSFARFRASYGARLAELKHARPKSRASGNGLPPRL